MCSTCREIQREIGKQQSLWDKHSAIDSATDFLPYIFFELEFFSSCIYMLAFFIGGGGRGAWGRGG